MGDKNLPEPENVPKFQIQSNIDLMHKKIGKYPQAVNVCEGLINDFTVFQTYL